MLKLILTTGLACLLAACSSMPGYTSSQSDSSSTRTMGAPGTTNTMGAGGGYTREPANF